MNTALKLVFGALGLLCVFALIFMGYYLYHLNFELKSAQSDLASTTTSFTMQVQQEVDAFTNEQAKNDQLSAELSDLQNQNTALGVRVGIFSKLASIDPELLAKYSNIFFLNENYTPAKLSNIYPQFVFGTNTLQFESDALPFLVLLIDSARASGVDLSVISAYRSFGTQASLKSSYKQTFGAGTANSFSADQGYSEHQLGTAVDLTTTKVGDSFSGFDKTSAYSWLTNNAYLYGFILSYPQGNGYYVYEPWHWRFVGVKLAAMLHAERENFYDVDQRTINLYLFALFDPVAATSTASGN